MKPFDYDQSNQEEVESDCWMHSQEDKYLEPVTWIAIWMAVVFIICMVASCNTHSLGAAYTNKEHFSVGVK